MTNSTVLRKPEGAPKSAAKAKPGRVFAISMKGIPRVDAASKARLEATAKAPNGKRHAYPSLIAE